MSGPGLDFVAAMLMSCAVASCAQNDASYTQVEAKARNSLARWQQMAPRPETRVETVSYQHLVAFRWASAALDDQVRAELRDFLGAVKRVQGGRIERVSLRGVAANALARARFAALGQELRRLGFEPQTSYLPGTAADTNGHLTVVVDQTLVLTPDCATDQPDVLARPNTIWGCATATNLALMVAEPKDLIKGRALTPADAETLAAGIKRYRENQITPLVAPETTGTSQ